MAIRLNLDCCPLRAVTRFTEQLNIAFCVAPTRTNWDDVVKFEALLRATLHAAALVSLPDEKPDRLGNRLSLRAFDFL